MTPPESCEKAIKSENIAYASHVVTEIQSKERLVMSHVQNEDASVM
jgi:hypothetical protein